MNNANNGLVKFWNKGEHSKAILTPLRCKCTGDDWVKDILFFGQENIATGITECPKCRYGYWWILPKGYRDDSELLHELMGV